MTRERFSVLDHVRTAFPDARQGITLSVGVGQGKTMQECERLARQALDMAQARGGDQVAVKTANGFDFYGGRSRGVERRTKVRTRVIAAALRELMAESDVVLVMGHRLSDLDSLGSAAALTVAARKLGQRAYAVVRRSTTMAAELIRRYEAAGADGLFVEPGGCDRLGHPAHPADHHRYPRAGDAGLPTAVPEGLPCGGDRPSPQDGGSYHRRGAGIP